LKRKKAMKKGAHQNIQWFLSFLNYDLSEIDYDEKMKITSQAISIIFGMPEFVFGEADKPEMPADRWKEDATLMDTIILWQKENKLEVCQEYLMRHFESIMQTINEAKTFAKGWNPEFRNYFCLNKIDSELKMRLESPLIEFDHRVINKGEKDENVLFRLKKDSLLNAPIRLAFKAKMDEITLLFYFFEALKGVPLGALRQCPECERYFLHVTKKHKIYCTNNCAAKGSVRQKRKRMKKTDPEEYRKELAKDADRSRRYYVKKVQREKPARRPYKYKDSKEK
jgi:hypothetical protein